MMAASSIFSNVRIIDPKKAEALCYYSQSGVSIGYCAQIAGMTEEDFIEYLGENNISIFHFDDKEEFLEELSNA